jgi:hypothetical protein
MSFQMVEYPTISNTNNSRTTRIRNWKKPRSAPQTRLNSDNAMCNDALNLLSHSDAASKTDKAVNMWIFVATAACLPRIRKMAVAPSPTSPHCHMLRTSNYILAKATGSWLFRDGQHYLQSLLSSRLLGSDGSRRPCMGLWNLRSYIADKFIAKPRDHQIAFCRLWFQHWSLGTCVEGKFW